MSTGALKSFHIFLGMKKALCMLRKDRSGLNVHLWLTPKLCLHEQEVQEKAALQCQPGC